MSEQFLLITDVDAIQRYVFESARMATIVGASEIVKAFDVWLEEEARRAEYGALHAALSGGNGLFVFGDSKKAASFAGKLTCEFQKRSGSGTISVSEIIPFEDDAGFPAARDAALCSLQRLKRLGRAIPEALDVGLSRQCQYCGAESALPKSVRKGDDERDIGTACRKKLDKRKEIKNAMATQHWAEDFNDLADTDYLALIAIDGDGIGARLKNLQSAIAYENFSAGVKCLLDQAIAAGMNTAKGEYPPFQLLYAGGDDIVIAAQARYALNFALAFSDAVQTIDRSWDWTADQLPIGFSFGISITHSKFPFRASHAIADQLLRNAKNTAKDKVWPEGAIDFAVVTEASCDPASLMEDREILFDNSKICFTGKPYRLKSGEPHSLSKLKEACKALDRFPKNQLYALRNQLNASAWRTNQLGGSISQEQTKLRLADYLNYVSSRVMRVQTQKDAWEKACQLLPVAEGVFPHADLADSLQLFGEF